MKNKYVTVRWINFLQAEFYPLYNWKTELSHLYKRPSSAKQNVFRYWKNNLYDIYWLTWNLYSFTIYWCIIDDNGVLRDVKITPSYNYIEKF